jgi:hypothetical protein
MPPTTPPLKQLSPSGKPATNAPEETQSVQAPFLGKLDRAYKAPRIVLNTIEGWGKTTVAAYAPEPAILMAREETGYETLLYANRVPSVAASHIKEWPQLIALLDQLIAMPEMPYKTLALDAMAGFEKLCFEHICNTQYGKDMSKKGFLKYGEGPQVAANEWLLMIHKLSQINDKGAIILLLSHYTQGTAPNPAGEDYQKFLADMHKKIWAPTARWADAIFFGDFLMATEEDGLRTKAIGDATRILVTEHRAHLDAKNRYGLPPEITMPKDPALVWQTIWNEIQRAINTGKEK